MVIYPEVDPCQELFPALTALLTIGIGRPQISGIRATSIFQSRYRLKKSVLNSSRCRSYIACENQR